jgi:hypothetical protein
MFFRLTHALLEIICRNDVSTTVSGTIKRKNDTEAGFQSKSDIVAEDMEC